ncbi:hypothetical protein GJ744_001869 [Endocarpon pusillum]|uniref:Uncharacterized protein n=1 Tax=Endocarpon pusillum TaxID=364733 RepID=A0A8H7ASM5_9EURO|nr:hypothetical protein GJ744_001869 [Endocarpon pusillum]
MVLVSVPAEGLHITFHAQAQLQHLDTVKPLLLDTRIGYKGSTPQQSRQQVEADREDVSPYANQFTRRSSGAGGI